MEMIRRFSLVLWLLAVSFSYGAAQDFLLTKGIPSVAHEEHFVFRKNLSEPSSWAKKYAHCLSTAKENHPGPTQFEKAFPSHTSPEKDFLFTDFEALEEGFQKESDWSKKIRNKKRVTIILAGSAAAMVGSALLIAPHRYAHSDSDGLVPLLISAGIVTGAISVSFYLHYRGLKRQMEKRDAF